jgi:surface protein
MKKFLFSIICALLPILASAQEPYAILIDNGTALEFRYDNDKSAYRDAMSVGPFTSMDQVPWHAYNQTIISVVFNESFANCTSITSTALWFAFLSNLQEIVGIQYLTTANVTDMYGMFWECWSLTRLDLTHFYTANVTDMGSMFAGCRSLTTITVSSGWTTANVLQSSAMFEGCTSLVGGAGTTYNSNHTDVAFAHIDSENNPGYLTGSESNQNEAFGSTWEELNSLLAYGDNVLSRARNSTIDPWMVEELEMFLERGHEMYNEHTADEQEVRHMIEELNWIIREVEEALNNQTPDDPHGHGDASFDGLTAWVNGSSTLDDAFTNVGGRSEAAKTIAAIVWNADEPLTADMLDGISNPNLLVFVTEASKAPSGVQNLVINGTAAEIVLTDATGNNNFHCPQAFTAQSISYSRTFSQTTKIEECRGWETISLPFTVQSIRHQSHGALVPFGAGNNGYPFWLRQLNNSGLARATQIEANKPYLISMPNNSVYPSVYNQNGTITFSSSNVTVPVTSAQNSSGAGVTLRAAFQSVPQGSGVYALNVGEARGSYPEGSVFEQNYREIRPFQAFTNHNSGARFISVESLGGGGDDDTTGIEDLTIEDPELREGPWYSLDGRRLDGRPTKKGVYIKNGKKLVIK